MKQLMKASEVKKPPEPKKPKYELQETDLRSITRETDRCRTVVTIELTWEKKLKWLIFGQAQLSPTRDRPDGRWELSARMNRGATDFEHDAAYALKLPLIGVEFNGVRYHCLDITAWIGANEDAYESFRVPRPGYDPVTNPKTHICEDKACGEPHPIVPEGLWIPPLDLELFRLVAGKRVEISIRPIYSKEDEDEED